MRTRGEVSVFVLGGRVVSQVDKLPAGDEVRVHEEFGGASRPGADRPGGRGGSPRSRTPGWPSASPAGPLDYVRVDLLLHDDEWVVSELELIEPGLYLDVLPANADPFADLVVARLG